MGLIDQRWEESTLRAACKMRAHSQLKPILITGLCDYCYYYYYYSV